MARLIEGSWECGACGLMNHLFLKKPSILGFTVMTATCETCDSIFQIRFQKMPRKHELGYTFLNSEISEKGKKLLAEKQKPK